MQEEFLLEVKEVLDVKLEEIKSSCQCQKVVLGSQFHLFLVVVLPQLIASSILHLKEISFPTLLHVQPVRRTLE